MRDKVPPATKPTKKPRISYVFLMGDVKRDNFYKAAKLYFENKVKGAVLVTDKRTLADIIGHVNSEGKPVDNLYIVSHANESGNLSFSLDAADLRKDLASKDKKPRIEYHELIEANKAGTLPKADISLIDEYTKVRIKGCNIGRSTATLDALDEAFGGKTSVIAPTHKQEYRFHSSGVFEESLHTMFVEEPGVVTKSRTDWAAAMQSKYSMVPTTRWKALLKLLKQNPKTTPTLYTHTQPNPPADDAASVKRRLRTAELFPKKKGWTVTYKGRTIDGGNHVFHIVAERVRRDGGTEWEERSITAPIPPDESALIAQEKAKHGRPGAYTWRVQRSVNKGTLTLRVIAERTEWIIPVTIKDASGPYAPAESDAAWYATSTFQPSPTP